MADEILPVQEEVQPNPIYKFLKDNGLTTKDETTFAKEYSNKEKQKELYKFMSDNKLTTKDFNAFSSDNFGALKKYTQPKSIWQRLKEWFNSFPPKEQF